MSNTALGFTRIAPGEVPGLPMILVRLNRWPTTTDVGLRVSNRARAGLTA